LTERKGLRKPHTVVSIIKVGSRVVGETSSSWMNVTADDDGWFRRRWISRVTVPSDFVSPRIVLVAVGCSWIWAILTCVWNTIYMISWVV